MTLPASGQIAASQISQELGSSGTARLELNWSAPRTLAGKSSGTISFDDFHGKSRVLPSGTIPAGAIVDNTYAGGGSRSFSLAAATDGNINSCASMFTHCENASTSGSGNYITASKACTGSYIAATITWDGTVTPNAQFTANAHAHVNYSLDNGNTWTYGAISKYASWDKTTETIFTGISLADKSFSGSTVRLQVVTTGDIPTGSQDYSDLTVHVYELTFILT